MSCGGVGAAGFSAGFSGGLSGFNASFTGFTGFWKICFEAIFGAALAAVFLAAGCVFFAAGFAAGFLTAGLPFFEADFTGGLPAGFLKAVFLAADGFAVFFAEDGFAVFLDDFALTAVFFFGLAAVLTFFFFAAFFFTIVSPFEKLDSLMLIRRFYHIISV